MPLLTCWSTKVREMGVKKVSGRRTMGRAGVFSSNKRCTDPTPTCRPQAIVHALYDVFFTKHAIILASLAAKCVQIYIHKVNLNTRKSRVLSTSKLVDAYIRINVVFIRLRSLLLSTSIMPLLSRSVSSTWFNLVSSFSTVVLTLYWESLPVH